MAQTASGSFLYVSVGTPATNDLAGVSALTWAEVGLIEEIQPIEETREEVSVTLLSGTVIRLAGAWDKGIIDMTVLKDGTDAGHAIAKAAFRANTETVYCKLTTPDGDEQYSSGQVMSFTQVGLNANEIMRNGIAVSKNAIYE